LQSTTRGGSSDVPWLIQGLGASDGRTIAFGAKVAVALMPQKPLPPCTLFLSGSCVAKKISMPRVARALREAANQYPKASAQATKAVQKP